MQHPKHLLFICPGFAKDEHDDTCIPALQDYFLELKALHPTLKISIIALQYPFKIKPYSWNGLAVFPRNASGLSLFKKLKHWKNTVKLAKEIHSNDPIDLVHSFWLHEAYYVGSKISKRLKLPLVASGGGQEVKPGNLYLKFFKKKAQNYICSSKVQQQLLKENYGIKSQIIHMGLRMPGIPTIPKKTIDILGAGNFTKNKNYVSFVRIVGQLKTTFPHLKVVLAGDGAEKDQIQAEIDQYGLQNNLILMGKISRANVHELMAQSCLFLHPAYYESFGMVYPEALAFGMHIVSKNTGIVNEQVKGHLYESEDEAIKIILKLLQTKLEHHPDFPLPCSNMVEAYMDVYSKVLTR